MNQPLTPERIAEIRERVKAASRSPWSLSYENCDCCEDDDHGLYVSRINTGVGPATELRDLPNGEWELTVHAREDVPVLLAEVDRLRAERDAFAHRVDTLTAVAKSNKRHVQGMYADLQKANRERDELKKRLHDAAMAKTWTNEDGSGLYPGDR